MIKLRFIGLAGFSDFSFLVVHPIPLSRINYDTNINVNSEFSIIIENIIISDDSYFIYLFINFIYGSIICQNS